MFDVKTYSSLNSLPAVYSRVFDQATRESFFLSLAWFQNFERTIIKGNECVQVYGIEESGGHPVAAILLRRKSTNGGWFSPREIESLSNYYSCHFAPVVNGDLVDAVAVSKEIARALWTDRHLWDVIHLHPVRQDSLVFSSLVSALREMGMIVQTYFCFGNWYLEVNGRSYQQYLEGLPSVLRKNIPYNIRRLERSGRGRIRILTVQQGLAQALQDYEKVYKSSWKGPEPYPEFIPGLVEKSAGRGWLRLGLAYIDEEPAAAQIWIVNDCVASIYKIAYDERFAKLSLGTVLTAKLMEHAIDIDKVRVVDYLSGDDEYKRNWMSHRREFWGILAFNPRTASGILQSIKHVGGRFAKRKLLKVLGRNSACTRPHASHPAP